MTERVSLSPTELAYLAEVFESYPEISAVTLFGSRAKGTQTPQSDVDLALHGDIDALGAQAIAAELDALPLPYHYDVKSYATITFPALREHIDRAGIAIYTRGEVVAPPRSTDQSR